MQRKKKFLALLLVVSLVFIAACSKGNTEENKPQPNNGPTTEGDKPSAPVELTMFRDVSGDIKFKPGESMDNNLIYDAIEKDLNIRLKNIWVADAAQYQQKLQMSISANDIADLMQISLMQMQQLIEADMIMDLTDVFEQYATPETKAYMTGDGGKQMDSAKVNGRLMAIPSTGSPYGSSTQIWIRRDWLKQLGLPEPKTMDDVLAIARAFAAKDPGGTGKNYAFPLTRDFLNDGTFDIKGFFNGYHAYPGQWVKDENGSLVYGSIQPQVKVALQELQNLYKEGLLDTEFAVKDVAKVNELLASNQIGIAYGPFWLSYYPLFDNAVKDGKLVQDWWPYPIVSHDAEPALSQIELGVGSYYVVSKSAKHPEAVIQLLNKWVQAYNDPQEGDEVYLYRSEDSSNYWKINPIRVNSQTETLMLGQWVPEAVEAKDGSKLTGLEAPDRYNKIMKYLDGDAKEWAEYPLSGPDGALSIMYDYFEQDRYKFNEFFGAPGPAMTEKLAVLTDKINEVFTKIVMNQIPIEEFDKLVEQFDNLGGKQITEEVNTWYQSTAN
ncbi:ABC transporter substrate-binding protein [Paenibacillus sp. 598K]|uniref:extracellular solute-binding protein n=1 Tax=Paenibacillus sp. 598K TaxID=1117987 RepID=UPI000FFA085E|nr:extracellular solute-binding protein [Paenibacillus sp. 598K]GBF77700.1 ABC transporter substrate-binding protein [Paenibacillus sp. 598K]